MQLDATTLALTQSGETFFYPAIGPKFTVDEDALAQGFRKQIGYTRVLGLALGVVLAGWLTDYVRG